MLCRENITDTISLHADLRRSSHPTLDHGLLHDPSASHLRLDLRGTLFARNEFTKGGRQQEGVSRLSPTQDTRALLLRYVPPSYLGHPFLQRHLWTSVNALHPRYPQHP